MPDRDWFTREAVTGTGTSGSSTSYLTEVGRREMAEGKVMRAEWFSGFPPLCPACGAGWTGSPCSHCHYEAPVPVDFQGRPFVPSPAPRDEARRKDLASRARDMANDANLSMVPVARHLLDACATELDALNRKLIDMYERIIPEQIQSALAAAPRADREEVRRSRERTESLIRDLRDAQGRLDQAVGALLARRTQ